MSYPVRMKTMTFESQSMSPAELDFGPRRKDFDLREFTMPRATRRAFGPRPGFFGKDFHPWQNDNRYIIEEWAGQQSQHRRPA